MPISISLTGGLGNQLFQYFAGLSVSRSLGEHLIIHSNLGKPRSSLEKPDLFAFNLGEEVQISNSQSESRILQKAFNYSLSSNLKRIEEQDKEFLKSCLNFMSALTLKIYLRKHRIDSVFSSDDLGFVHLGEVKSNSLVIGYFQSYKYFQTLADNERNLRLKDGLVDAESKNIFERATQVEPLVVHRRLGDYRHERNFGIPRSRSFHNPLRELWRSGRYGEIWAFTDESNFDMSCIPNELWPYVRTFEKSSCHPALTLTLMSQGKGYVISNSSFSYWAAMFARNRDSSVQIYAPIAWFKNINSPVDLIPPDWCRFLCEFEN